MDVAASTGPPRNSAAVSIIAAARTRVPSLSQAAVAAGSAALMVAAFPDFNLWPLAWVALAPLLVIVARDRGRARSFLLGWLAGTLFFYGACYWLTYPLIRYGGIPTVVAYALLAPVTLIVGLFPALCMALVAQSISRWGLRAIFLAPAAWVALEWARLGVTGQLWDAIGYSQAFHPFLIQSARVGGVYAVGFLIVTVNSAVAYAWCRRDARGAAVSGAAVAIAALVIACAALSSGRRKAGETSSEAPAAVLIGVQPDVPLDPVSSPAESLALRHRHIALSEEALSRLDTTAAAAESQQSPAQSAPSPAIPASVPRVVVWPESPMNFQYARDIEFREFITDFAERHHVSVLFNALEPAPRGGGYNAAVMVSEEGRLVAQYDKIRLLPFGEYMPLPREWPGVSMIPVMVGDFTPGEEFNLMPIGDGGARAGVFICFESAFPSIAREFTSRGADALINISDDGYLGPTAVMRQHLANAIFRAVENDRPVARVTNTGISALITAAGEVRDPTPGFVPAARTWTVSRAASDSTFYTTHGDVFAAGCAALTLLAAAGASLSSRGKASIATSFS